MTETSINPQTSAEELAARISQALEAEGISATLSGGAAVTLYTDNEYESFDLDFVTSERTSRLSDALAPLGFTQTPGGRHFVHASAAYCIEFPPGPLSFGETTLSHSDATVVDTEFGPLRIITPTQSIMDRLAAYTHWTDPQSFDQAVMVARRQPVDWTLLEEWASREGVDHEVIKRLHRLAGPN